MIHEGTDVWSIWSSLTFSISLGSQITMMEAGFSPTVCFVDMTQKCKCFFSFFWTQSIYWEKVLTPKLRPKFKREHVPFTCHHLIWVDVFLPSRPATVQATTSLVILQDVWQNSTYGSENMSAHNKKLKLAAEQNDRIHKMHTILITPSLNRPGLHHDLFLNTALFFQF